MDKNAIRKYAVWARRELIEKVSQKALQYGIEEGKELDSSLDSIGGVLLTEDEQKQRQALISKIKDNGYAQVIEEVSYTWFNRFIALRFMEVNGYLPSHIRVFSDESGNFKPQIMSEALHLELNGLNKEKVYELKNENKDDELFKYLLIAQCNELSYILPKMFQKISDYTELLLPDNLLRDGSVIERMVTQGTSDSIPESDWTDQVQIIGWLYQYYNIEPKDKVFADLKNNIKVSKENIPAATQLFTPDWIVHYMVENSLGRLWLEGHPNDELKTEWKFYLDDAEQEETVQEQLAKIRKEYAALKPEEIRVIDPCSGSGHILCVFFDVLVHIYEDYGYSAREAVASIVENNIWGLDIDERAAQLSYFTVMMKARQYDRRFLTKKDENGNPEIPQPHVYAIEESNGIDLDCMEYFTDGRIELKTALSSLINDLHDAKDYGSLIDVAPVDFNVLYARIEELRNTTTPSIFSYQAIGELLPLINVAQALSQKYDVLVTNPPYMGCRNINGKLVSYIEKNYANSKTDLFSCFMERGLSYVKNNGFSSLVTMQSWMFLTSFEKFRIDMFNKSMINSLLHMDNMVMGIAFGTSATVFRKVVIKKYLGRYNEVNYVDLNDDLEVDEFPIKKNRNSIASIEQFSNIDGEPVAYWLSETAVNAFKNKVLGEYAKPRQGMATSDNNRFLRLWFEVEKNKAYFTAKDATEAENSHCKWFPYNKGGSYRKWYGNNDYLLNWENDGAEVKALATSLYKCVTRTIKNIQFYFQKGITWSTLSSGNFSARYCPEGFLFDTKGSTCFFDNDEMISYCISFLNGKVASELLKVLAPTMDFNAGSIARLPIKYDITYKTQIDELVERCIELSKNDWDSFEYSWDFAYHPMLPVYADSEDYDYSIEDFYRAWEDRCERRFYQLKESEEALNNIFINIYGLQDELTPEIDEKEVTVRKADLNRDIKSLISFAVGCMFGRYNLWHSGLAYAGGEWNSSIYDRFPADKDNIIPICDDEYFEDDIVGRFVEFIRVAFGDKRLEENLRFIADALGGKGASRDVIRNYFINDFYADHLKVYQKRPIYWLFDSGKKNGFKCLVYMHRYQPDTIARIRTDYVHEQQARYRTAIEETTSRIDSASGSDKVKLTKKLNMLKDQNDEIHVYEEKIHHLADQMISINLDDGVKKNYEIFKDVLAKIK